jgi:uncharacterized iron-regulated protein
MILILRLRSKRAMVVRQLLLALVFTAAPLLAQAPEPRAWDSRAGRWVEWGTMADSLARQDVVVVGEQHDDPATHRAEAALLDAIGRRNPRVMVSLEMFERDVQPLLDDYGVGRVTEADFLAGSRPWPNYASDYRPLVEHARARRWPVVAANVPRPLASAVARGGMAALDTLPLSHRRLWAAERRCAPEGDYFRRFGEAMGGMQGHGAGTDSAAARATLARFYAAQCIKDETMAESIARALYAWRGWMVVHYTGGFHAEQRLGTVERVARRLPGALIAVVIIIPVPDPSAVAPAEFADRGDYVVFVPAPASPAAPQP